MRKLLVLTLVLGMLLAACAGGTATVTQDIKSISPATAYDEIQANADNVDFELIDVRTPDEYKAGKVAGAINIDFYAADFKDKLNDLDRDKYYIIYCHTGNRSGQTLKIMRELGFLKVYDIAGGIAAWAQDGLPVAP